MAVGQRELANELTSELVEAWRRNEIRQPHECTSAPWLFAALGRAGELQVALERASAWTRWHEAAQRVIRGQLVEAAETFHQIGSVPDEAYARVRAAEDRLAAGDRLEADRQLALALPVLAELRATAWTAAAEALLAESA
jgi:hypothetical protein